jgi:hypothetical protein
MEKQVFEVTVAVALGKCVRKKFKPIPAAGQLLDQRHLAAQLEGLHPLHETLVYR